MGLNLSFDKEALQEHLRHRPTQIKLGVAGLCLLVALVLTIRALPESDGGKHVAMPRISTTGTLYACGDPKCGVTFHLTDDEIATHERKHAGEPYTCPVCHANTAGPAVVCPKCGEFTPVLAERQCVHCKAALPKGIETPKTPNDK